MLIGYISVTVKIARAIKMKIKISVPQIFCRKITIPRVDPDEAYFAYFITLAKSDKETGGATIKKYTAKRISAVKKHVKNGTRWEPENLEAIIDTEDAEAMFITMGLYEYDDGGIYKKLVNVSENIIEPEDYDWSDLELPVNITDWMTWVRCVWKLVAVTFNYLKQDDLLGTETIATPLVKEAVNAGWDGLREFQFKKYGGDYRVSLKVDVLED